MSSNLRIEFHCHTMFSGDSLARPEEVISEVHRKHLDRVVITDHNTIEGARAAQELDPEIVIVGEEILTTHGEILAAFVIEEVPKDLPPLETIRRLRNQGAFISVSHPFDRLRSGHWTPIALEEIVPLVDAIEVFNARCMLDRFNRHAAQFSRERRLPGTVGSDAHAAFEVGAAVMSLPQFEGPDGLRQVIRKVKFQTQMLPYWVHFVSRYASLRKRFRV